MMPCLLRKERASRSRPVRQERVAAGGVLCYIYLAIDKGEHGSYLPVQMEPDTVLYFYPQWE